MFRLRYVNKLCGKGNDTFVYVNKNQSVLGLVGGLGGA